MANAVYSTLADADMLRALCAAAREHGATVALQSNLAQNPFPDWLILTEADGQVSAYSLGIDGGRIVAECMRLPKGT